MEKLQFEYDAGAPAVERAMVGVVGSGDLEVLLEPGTAGRTTVQVTTSVNGFAPVWKAQLDRVFQGGMFGPQGLAMKVEINDFGATPGVVGMRIAQAFAEIGGGRGAGT